MDKNTISGVSHSAIMYLVHHMFLPPKLPQEDDSHHEHETAMLNMTICALQEFKRCVTENHQCSFDPVIDMVSAMVTGMNTSDTGTGVSEWDLRNALRHLGESLSDTVPTQGGVILLHIRAQNAGVMISKVNHAVRIEGFELSPLNGPVITTKGRLRRSFPGFAYNLTAESFDHLEFQETMAHTLAKMSHQPAVDTKPKAKKAGRMHDENRDTTHPKIVTELFTAFLRSVTTPLAVPCLWKNTRDEVLWHGALLPWRRSPTWLLLRVAMQLVFSRLASSTESSTDYYKTFMVFLLGKLLDMSLEHALPSDLLYAMNTKLGRRLLKLDPSIPRPGLSKVRDVMQKAIVELRTRWHVISRDACPDLNLSLLPGLDFREDAFFVLDGLEGFIGSRFSGSSRTSAGSFEPASVLVKYPTATAPGSLGHSTEYAAYNLQALEAWVASELPRWLENHLGDFESCEKLGSLIEMYHGAASTQYLGNPESLSISLLTILELWIACDQLALHSCELLRDYDSGIPSNVGQSMTLPFKSQMQRLLRAETYLDRRRARAHHQAPSVYSDFCCRHSFAVRFFDQSSEHQRLRQTIERDAARMKQSKLDELRQKKERYRSLMRLHDEGQCEFYEVVVDDEYDLREQRHSSSCRKCGYRSQAANIDIKIYEWPLPSDDLQAKATVFELKVPVAIASWRDTALFVLLDVLEGKFLSLETPRARHPLRSYSGLSSYFHRSNASQRLMLLSECKPHGVTHRRQKSIAVTAESDVCLANGLLYRYYHGVLGNFVGKFHIGDEISKRLMYRLPPASATLQPFLFRPPNSSGLSPNTVIATQSECPRHMSLGEYKALSTIPLGHQIQWKNILVQLTTHVVDFKKAETNLVILQTIYQAGLSSDGNVLRDGHYIIGDERFTNVLVTKLREALKQCRQNWESCEAFSTFISVAARISTLSAAADVKARCVAFLADVRIVTFNWAIYLRNKVAEATEDRHAAAMLCQAVKLALICVGSFHVDDEHLSDLMTSCEDASIFIQCCIFIHESTLTITETVDPVMPILIQRWRQVCYRCYPVLARSIRDDRSRSLDDAIKKAWSAYVVGDDWRTVSSHNDEWLVSQTSPEGGLASIIVHYNLLTGELLADGLPLVRLPSKYSGHFTYRILFGGLILDVMPTTMRGMQFSAKKDHAGHSIYFGMRSFSDTAHPTDLLVRAVRNDRTYDFIPARFFDDKLPDAFVRQFVHWYDAMEDCVEFRPIGDPWSSSATNWKLTRAGNEDRWRLRREGQSLINIQSETARTISEIVSPLEKGPQIHIILDPVSSTLDIDLPKLQLAFSLRSGTSSLQSKQFRGYHVDPDQSLGTLVGLRGKLLLRCGETGRRLVVVPEGHLTQKYGNGHIRILVDHDSSVKAHTYHVDDRLGTLVDNGTLQSKLWLCYLHALTSFCLPDRLTKRTGTEQSLSILNSAAVRSFDRLTRENVEMLHHIALLTPGRSHYPANERVMQTVKWMPGLSFLSQPGGFHRGVKYIFDQADRMKMFYQESYITPPNLGGVDPDLLERDCIRSSAFRISDFGAEDDTYEYDAVYSGRDIHQDSPAASQAFLIADSVFLWRNNFHHHVQAHLGTRLWGFLSQESTIFGPGRPFPPSEISYDAGLLQDWPERICRYWCTLHRTFSQIQPRFDKFRLMIWLSTLAFARNANVEIVQALVAFFVLPRMAQLTPPAVHSFRLSQGARFQKADLRHAMRGALRSLNQCPESNLTRRANETKAAWKQRRQGQFQNNQDRALNRLLQALEVQWPREFVDVAGDSEINTYVNINTARQIIIPIIQGWFNNHRLQNYLDQIGDVLQSVPVTTMEVPPARLASLRPSSGRVVPQGQSFVSADDVFAVPPPFSFDRGNAQLKVDLVLATRGDKPTPRLESLLTTLGDLAGSEFEQSYIKDLQTSLHCLQKQDERYSLSSKRENLYHSLLGHLHRCKHRFEDYSAALCSIAESNPVATDQVHFQKRHRLKVASSIEHGPRLCPRFFLQQLSHERWPRLSSTWQRCLVQYALALTELQRAERLIGLSDNEVDLVKELRTIGHTNWDPLEFPETLLLEAEAGIMVREVQEEVACEMRHPSGSENAVMQLNMGEGKSTVIVPMVSAALANHSQLVRVIVARPQSRQMFQMLVSKLGGLLNRRVYHMPFSRSVKLDQAEAAMIDKICRECMTTGGVLLVQPEHILSFKLMSLECLIRGKDALAQSLIRTQEFFNNSSRDIVDESDENFSVKFELIYTMGMQQPIELSPQRWVCIQEVLELVRMFAHVTAQETPTSIEVKAGPPGSFPQTRILEERGQRVLFDRIARYICDSGLRGFPIARQPECIREAVFRYLTEPHLSSDEVSRVESRESGRIWTDATSQTLLLLRGLIAGRVLTFAFGHKRWRVHYGLAPTRLPCTKLAVPYRAKDSPTARSEFSHPDVVIVLTSLSHYYNGLTDGDLFLTFAHLLKSDQADIEYQAWVKDAPDLPTAFRLLTAINLKDRDQCMKDVFPPLRYAKNVVDYFLAHVVFPKEMREFPHKLSTSGWDIGQRKTHPTTGFSGTNDSRLTLPLSVVQLELSNQKHTNALVLDHLLQPDNLVVLMPAPAGSCITSAKSVLSTVAEMDPSPQVILDVGAQILELSNLEVATEWLRMVPHHDNAQAVVFFDDNDELSIIDRKGQIEPLQTSPFATQLDMCLVFLDEVHTRGTDLKLPKHYKAAVTLGASLTKDRLVQACMRMRKLGQGQTVIFLVPGEIKNKILARARKPKDATVYVSDVLSWAVSETCIDLQRSMPLWAVQGQRFERQRELWTGARVGGDLRMSRTQAEDFLEAESQSLEQRYRPGFSTDMFSSMRLSRNVDIRRIAHRCDEFRGIEQNTATLQEEQERELSPEIVQEREVQRPGPATPAPHCVHPDLVTFVVEGTLARGSDAFIPAFESLRSTSAAKHLDVSEFPRDLLVTVDFATTVEVAGQCSFLDMYQRPVQWVLTSIQNDNLDENVVEHMIIISPYEAHTLQTRLRNSKAVALHLYAPRCNLGHPPLDTLDLYTVSGMRKFPTIPRSLITQLNLFAGQLYLGCFNDYVETCTALGLAWQKTADRDLVGADGFIIRTANGQNPTASGFKESPVPFLRVLMTKIRRTCEDIGKTHLGAVLDGRLLHPSDFGELAR